MELQIVMTSIIAYLILFNSCLTFRLNLLNNLVIVAVLSINIFWVHGYIGSFFVIPMFIIIVLYIRCIKKEDWFLNCFLIFSCYSLLIIVDNVTHLVWSFVDMNLRDNWLIYIIINYPIFWLICRYMSKCILKLKNREFFTMSPRIQAILCTDLALCLLIFILNMTIADKCGASWIVLMSGIVMYIAYFACTYLMVTTIIHEYEKNAKIMLKQNSYDNLHDYIVQIEEMYQTVRAFKHDYANIMISMAGYIEAGDIKGLERYYVDQVYPISNQLNRKKDAISGLHNLYNVELKSLIYVKITYAQELDIDVSLDITDKIEKINIKSVDLVRIIGILLDNAIEACQQCKEPSISFSVVKMDSDITFIIRNTYIRQNIDYSKLGSIGVSSKGERRGTGLYNIKSILNDYENVVLDTEYENYFTQFLEIYDKK